MGLRFVGASGEGVGKLGLATLDELEQLGVDRVVDGRWLVGVEPRSPEPLARWAASSPPSSSHCSKLRVVGGVRAVERRLEVGERVCGAEVVLAGRVLADGVERLAVLGQVEPWTNVAIIPNWSASSTNFS